MSKKPIRLCMWPRCAKAAAGRGYCKGHDNLKGAARNYHRVNQGQLEVEAWENRRMKEEGLEEE